MLVPLRAFLGFTFCFAGLQKLANPGFFTASNPASIQSQLAGAALRSPIHSLITPLTHVAVPLGVLIAFSELAIGIGTILGLWQRPAAAGGIVLSFMLFLTVSFHSAPYYTGADIVFTFAWTPLLLAGAGQVLSVDAALAAQAATADTRRPPRQSGRRPAGRSPQPSPEVTRKSVITVFAALGGLALGVIVGGIGRLAGGTSSGTGTTLPLAPATRGPGSSSGGSGSGGSSQHVSKSGGQRIGPAADVPVGGAAGFTDPKTGNPSIVLRPNAKTFLAYDAVCPHAGCTVGFQQSANLLVCPCHGSEFNAATGAVESGPAPTGLAPIHITENGGQLYVD
jgi:thiosulfate dehydrogenase [quinone] large subunit